ncbi:MAG: hypothetical protein P4M15_04675 [Alphaproteobacteria bacterium]|nr:hypothetical protein [Alphaproteobacteria bacterium]
MTYIVFEERAGSSKVVGLPTFRREWPVGVVKALIQPFGVSIPILSRAVMVLGIFAALFGLQQLGAVHRPAARVDIARTLTGSNVSQDAPFLAKAIP